MSQAFNVAVLGATGLVGQTMIELLEQRKFPVAELFPLASSRSAGAPLRLRARTSKYWMPKALTGHRSSLRFSRRVAVCLRNMRP